LSTDTRAAVRIDVETGTRSSAVWIGEGIAEQLPALLDGHGVGKRRFIVSSPVIWRLHGAQLQHLGSGGEPILIPDGERYKNLQSVARIYEALIRAGADRGSAIVAVGGGVIGDTAGFAAATFLRGVTLAHVPTTLLAQVDSAIGGKVGVNHPLGKNMIGAFYQPHAVVIDPLVLGTLPRREFRAGLYEVIKYGMTSSAPLFDRVARERKAIFSRAIESLMPIIEESCRIKGEVVTADEREAGPRRILNFGHTAGHAIEAVTRYRRFRHGEAVGYGMLVAAELSAARGALSNQHQKALADLIVSLGPLPPISDLSSKQMLEAIRHDKKVVAGKLHFVLPTAIGSTSIVDDVTEKEMKAAMLKVGFRK